MADAAVGTYPPEQEAPGIVKLRQLAAGGFHQDELDQYKQKNSSLMLNNGFTKAEVDHYWGDDTPPPPTSATNYAATAYANVPPERCRRLPAMLSMRSKLACRILVKAD